MCLLLDSHGGYEISAACSFFFADSSDKSTVMTKAPRCALCAKRPAVQNRPCGHYLVCKLCHERNGVDQNGQKHLRVCSTCDAEIQHIFCPIVTTERP